MPVIPPSTCTTKGASGDGKDQQNIENEKKQQEANKKKQQEIEAEAEKKQQETKDKMKDFFIEMFKPTNLIPGMFDVDGLISSLEK